MKQNPQKPTMKMQSTLSGKAWPAFVIIFIIMHIFALQNLYLLSRDMIMADRSAKLLRPQPLYGLMRIPESQLSLQYHAKGRLGADFAQIYFTLNGDTPFVMAFDEQANPDPWGRASRIAPMIHYLCALTICQFPYGVASLLHMIIQVLVFFTVFVSIFRDLQIEKFLTSSFSFAIFCLFLTPAGLSFFERGQFSLYVAASYLLLTWGLFRKSPIIIVLSALLAFIKWTSLPFILVALAISLLSSETRISFKFTVCTIIVFALTFFLLSLPFITETKAFIEGLIYQELNRDSGPEGISLLFYLPRSVVKILPAALILMGAIIARKGGRNSVELAPFFTGVAILLLLYPTFAFEYSLTSILGLLPIMLFWAQQARPKQRFSRNLLLEIFLGFLLVASFSARLLSSREALVFCYVATSLILISSIFRKAKHSIDLDTKSELDTQAKNAIQPS